MSKPTRITRALAVAAAFGLLAGVAGAQDLPSLDDLLDLTPDQRTPADAEAPDADAPDAATTDDEPHADAEADRGADTPEQRDERLERILRSMQDASDRLGRGRDTGLDTQRAQQSAIEQLDALISQLEESDGESSGSPDAGEQDVGTEGSQQQAQADADPGTEAGTDGSPGRPEGEPDEAVLADRLNDWGNLPPRLRDELLQGLEDRFSPLYQELTEQYYRRLAEEAR